MSRQTQKSNRTAGQCVRRADRTPEKTFDNRPVGVFDSGIGGLTVAAALRRALPNEDIIYLGDTARVPYGSKSADAIIRFACQDVEFLMRKGVKAVVAACNTVSCVAMEHLRERFPRLPVAGVLEAGTEAVAASGADTVCVIGTRATVNSDAYRRGLHERDRSLIVRSIACPLFVPIVEEGIHDGPIARAAFELYLKELKKDPPRVLLLGCTHYPILKKALAKYLGSRVRIIDSADACAVYVERFLAEKGLSASPAKSGTDRFFLSDIPPGFEKALPYFLGCRSIDIPVSKAVLE